MQLNNITTCVNLAPGAKFTEQVRLVAVNIFGQNFSETFSTEKGKNTSECFLPKVHKSQICTYLGEHCHHTWT